MSASRALAAALALAGTVAACGGPAPAGPTSPASVPGRLVIVGGALARDNAAVYREILEARAGAGPLCVIPTATAATEQGLANATAAFDQHGGPGTSLGVMLTLERPAGARDAAIVRTLEGCSGYFFVGGDQNRITDLLLPAGDTTPALAAILRGHARGAVVAGNSAGAAIMTRTMIGGGASAEAVANGVRTAEGEGVLLRPGLGFMPLGIADQHFLARGRVGRLLVVALSPAGSPLAFGVDENTALVVDGDQARVVGASGVIVLDARRAERSATGRGGRGVRLHLAAAGDAIDLRTLALAPAAGGRPLAPGAPVEAPADPFARWAFLHLLAGLAGGPTTSVTVPAGDALLRIRRAPGFRAARRDGEGPDGTPRGLSAGPFCVDLMPAGGAAEPSPC